MTKRFRSGSSCRRSGGSPPFGAATADREVAAASLRSRPRLTAALGRVEAGEIEGLTKPLANSYHDIWMELHEDLIVTLQLTRTEADA